MSGSPGRHVSTYPMLTVTGASVALIRRITQCSRKWWSVYQGIWPDTKSVVIVSADICSAVCLVSGDNSGGGGGSSPGCSITPDDRDKIATEDLLF